MVAEKIQFVITFALILYAFMHPLNDLNHGAAKHKWLAKTVAVVAFIMLFVIVITNIEIVESILLLS